MFKTYIYTSISQSGEQFLIKITFLARAWEFSSFVVLEISIKTFLLFTVFTVFHAFAWKNLTREKDHVWRRITKKILLSYVSASFFVHLFTTNFYILQKFSQFNLQSIF